MKIREKILAHIEDRLNDIIPGNKTIDAYRESLMKLSDEEFEKWIEALENGVLDFPDPNKPMTTITLLAPNLSDQPLITVERNLKLAKKMGHSFHERIWFTHPVTGQTVLSNRRYLTMLLPIRRQAQTLDHKISLAANDTQVDDLTGQVTGEAKGSSISYPEIQMLDSQGLPAVINELTKTRGGDENAWRIMKRQLIETGSFKQESLDQVDTRSKVNNTLFNILAGMHIKNNV